MNDPSSPAQRQDVFPSIFDDLAKAAPQQSDAAPAICRICRGEGTSAEPLFYPCKCSGSIKYVHQDCLMEWLSHSQKKYCELCKTSFRFTKLYAPDMPQSLPVHIFLEHMAKYLVRNVLLWLRAVVTISVWVCWLPYFMRVVWAFMFWVSDEGLGAGPFVSRSSLSKPMVPGPAPTCAASPPYPFNIASPSDNTTVADKITFLNSTAAGSLSPTLLSDVGFLRNLTRSATVNRSVITVIEGQIITVLVIVCFILVILVRDYVVQQQPEINMRAAFADQENNNAPAPAQQPVDPEIHDNDDNPESDGMASDGEILDAGVEVHEPPWLESRLDIDTGEPAVSHTDTDTMHNAMEPERMVSELATDSQESSAQDEVVAGLDNRASVIDYLRVYRRAGGNLDKILQIVEEEHLEDKLGYWVDVTRRSIRERESASEDISGPSTSQEAVQSSVSSALDFTKLDDRGQPSPSGDEQDASQRNSKGKEREWLPMSPDSSPGPITPDHGIASSPSRPRARSDGPEPSSLTNPLANNSWTFDSLPTTNGVDPEWAAQTLVPDPPATAPVPSDNAGVRRRTVIPDSPPHSNHGDDAASIDHGSDTTHVVPDEPVAPIPEQRGFVGRIANFMWGDLDQRQDIEDEEQEPAANGVAVAVAAGAGHDDGVEDQWVDVPIAEAADANVDPNAGEVDAAAAAAAAGMDAEAMEDLEDFEGVMELLGMRGPIAGLFQNAIFCAVLVSVTIFTCIFIPYNIGRFSVWIIANPILLVRMLMGLSKVIQDAAMMMGGFGSWCALNIVDMFTSVIGGAMGAQIVSARKASWGLWTGAGARVVEYALMEFPLTASEVQNFSAISHGALNTLKANIGWVFGQVDSSLKALAEPDYASLVDGRFVDAASTIIQSCVSTLTDMVSLLLDPSSWVIDLGEATTGVAVDPSLAYWSGLDRFWAILVGYLTIFAVGALYLKRDSPFSRGAMMQAWEAGVIDSLHQASGIMKVILIISIEMLVFPLYCGLLLDGALLPLFEDTTFNSRILFTCNYPLTSIFVHWFVGTGYMFHFALFVSMCRKIMRPGVLYFIRDPDDPEFHPVRDVLERNLTTQLRKILFSAFVYGALVIVCLGGVVWGLYYTMPGVLPVHYSSNEPVLEFPVDLLFYNFLMPLAVKFFKPSDGLHAMYTWWFRKCARGLRLTYFLFGERRIDEEGILQLSGKLKGQIPPHKSVLLELDENNAVIPKTWRDTFEGGDAKPNPSISKVEMREMRHKKAHLVKTGQLKKSGRFVRAPASDRVKIPKGQRVFLTVSERNRRKDGDADDDMYASTQYQLVYVPPNFRARVFLFILFIWLFAAVTGVGFTIAPLVLGRTMFKMLIPDHIRTNDIYAFSIGIYVLGSLAYAIFRLGHVTARLREWTSRLSNEIASGNICGRVVSGLVRGAKLLYAYFFLLIVFPLLVSTLMELYLSIPLHTYMNPPPRRQENEIMTAAGQEGEAGRHTIRVIQSWTLGLLYLNLATRMITSLFPDSRAAIAVRSVMRRGYLKPDVDVFTRAFIIPGVALAMLAIFGPPATANLLINSGMLSPSQLVGVVADTANLSLVFRYSYPVAAVCAVMVRYAVGLTRVFNRWTAGVRDEAYLIGERLHNFGAATAGSRKARKAWGAAGGGRL